MQKTNVNIDALLDFARDAANFCTHNAMPNLQFAKNSRGAALDSPSLIAPSVFSNVYLHSLSCYRHQKEKRKQSSNKQYKFQIDQPIIHTSLKSQKKVHLESFVYYKDETHYFVMTAKKSSLLERGVFKDSCKDKPEELMQKTNSLSC
jgi:hypothetical protein